MHKIISMTLSAEKITDNKFRWDFVPSDGKAVFALYVPKWRIPEPWPPTITVRLYAASHLRQVEPQITERMASSNPSVRRRPIIALIERKEDKVNSVRYQPFGPNGDWEIGEPYIPHSLLPPDVPDTLQIVVEWPE